MNQLSFMFPVLTLKVGETQILVEEEAVEMFSSDPAFYVLASILQEVTWPLSNCQTVDFFFYLFPLLLKNKTKQIQLPLLFPMEVGGTVI